jgi:MarR family transcriptional regulator, lower aerobic nicotinate degradation pathway regulator
MERELLDGLVQTSFIMMGVLNRLATRNDLSLTQVRLLGILRDRQPKMAELADHLGLEKSTLTGLIDRAEQRGIVERLPDRDDARASQIGLTPQGRQLATNAAGEIAKETAFLVESFNAADRKRLLQLLQRLCRTSEQPTSHRRASRARLAERAASLGANVEARVPKSNPSSIVGRGNGNRPSGIAPMRGPGLPTL